MKLTFLPVNQRWAFTFGHALIRLHVSDRTLYETREQAIADAALCALRVAPDGTVSVHTVPE